MDDGKCGAIGLSDITLNELLPLYESARIKPAVVQVEAHPYLPETELLEFCKAEGHCVFGFCAIGSWNEAGAARRSSDYGNRRTSWKDAGTGAAGLGGTARHGFADHAQDCGPRRENFNISALPEDAFDEINRIQTRQRLNDVVNTGSPGFIPRGRSA